MPQTPGRLSDGVSDEQVKSDVEALVRVSAYHNIVVHGLRSMGDVFFDLAGMDPEALEQYLGAEGSVCVINNKALFYLARQCGLIERE